MPLSPYDPAQEATGCTNELFYRNGPVAEDIKRREAYLVSQKIEEYLRAAIKAVTLERDQARTELSELQGGIDGTISAISLLGAMYKRLAETAAKKPDCGTLATTFAGQSAAVAVVLEHLEKLKTRTKA